MLQTVQTHREVFSLFVTIIRLIPLLRYPEQKKKKKRKKKEERASRPTVAYVCICTCPVYLVCIYVYVCAIENGWSGALWTTGQSTAGERVYGGEGEKKKNM